MNPFYLSKAKQVLLVLYNGYEIVKTNHESALVHDSENTLKIAETTRKQMIEKNERPRIFWSDDLLKMKAKALKEKAKSAKLITAMMVYHPNTPAKLVPKVLLTKSQNENLIAECLSKDVLYTAIDSVLTVSRFSAMHDAYTVAQKCIAKLEAENFNLTQKIQTDDHDEMIKHFSKLEVDHLNLQLKYQHLKEHFGNKKSVTFSDAPAFESADPILDFKALDSQNKDLNAKVNALQDLNERFRIENEKVKQHYKELYDSIKLTRAKTIEKKTSLLTEIETLKAHIKGKTNCVIMPDPVKAKVLAPGMYAIDVEPIPPQNRNNREVHLEYFKHLKESVGTLHEIVEEARV
ncbi:hypothetical protein Tco_0801991 [Tanacetum coccineum]|uniref:Uncharacterized protein n=1 Tax=Tanacetum coccineum TaxID=301880 RepID=A0ABQ4ZXQ9_9ASTR